MKHAGDTWISGDPYDYYMGRWSRLMAPVFLEWLNLPHHLSWLDIGCGTGALGEAICRQCQPAHLSCIDPAAGFLEKAKQRLPEETDFAIGSASNIPKASHTFDVVASGLALNFFPDLPSAFSEMKRVLKANGILAAYVWDYAGRMDFLRIFWDAACAVDPQAQKRDEGIRFPICHPDQLRVALQQAGLSHVETAYLDINTVFRSFEDYWSPFLGRQGPAPAYLASLDEDLQDKIKTHILPRLPVEPDGSIKLMARAIAVRGIKKP